MGTRRAAAIASLLAAGCGSSVQLPGEGAGGGSSAEATTTQPAYRGPCLVHCGELEWVQTWDSSDEDADAATGFHLVPRPDGDMEVVGRYQGTIDFGLGQPYQGGRAGQLFAVTLTPGGTPAGGTTSSGVLTNALPADARLGPGGELTLSVSFMHRIEIGGHVHDTPDMPWLDPDTGQYLPGMPQGLPRQASLLARVGLDHEVPWTWSFGSQAAADGPLTQQMTYAATSFVTSDFGVISSGSFSGSVTFDDVTLQSDEEGDAFLVKLDPAGKVVWARRYGGDGDDGMAAIDDRHGGMIVTGAYHATMALGEVVLPAPPMGDAGRFVAKLDENGDHVWSTTIDALPVVRVRPDGSLLVAARFEQTLALGGTVILEAQSSAACVALLELDKHGKLTASRIVVQGAVDERPSMALSEQSGQIVLAGTFGGTLDVMGSAKLAAQAAGDFFVVKLDDQLEYLWSRRFGPARHGAAPDCYDPNEHCTMLHGLAIDGAGGTWLTGSLGLATDFGHGPVEPVIGPGAKDGRDLFVAKLGP